MFPFKPRLLGALGLVGFGILPLGVYADFTPTSRDQTNFDYNSIGVVSAVNTQGNCTSDYAFSVVEAIESRKKLEFGGTLTKLSPQQIIDCDTASNGCGGGLATDALSYVAQAGGLESLNSYPYTEEKGSCAFNSNNLQTHTIPTFSQIENGEAGIYAALQSGNGPVIAAVNASTWRDYNGGVLTQCSEELTTPQWVQITGYANYGQNGAYWIVRNSWGTDWGQSGYIWIAIGNNLCGIGNNAFKVTGLQ